MTKKILYLWACDNSKNTGEGKLARFYTKFLEEENNYKIKVCEPNKFLNYKYLSPFIGILYCWKIYLKNKRVGYINYLPLWNFFIFMLLPPKTILGPVTGGANFSNHKNLDFLIRKFFFPVFYKISQYFLSLRLNKIFFSTNLLKKHLSKKIYRKCRFDFIIKNAIFLKNISKKKDIDFLIYYRKHRNKENFFPYKFIEKLTYKKYRIYVIGDMLNIKKVKNCGFLKNKIVSNLQSRAKFTITTGENIYSIFTMECLFSGARILIDKKFNKQVRFFKNKFIPINFNKINNTLNFR